MECFCVKSKVKNEDEKFEKYDNIKNCCGNRKLGRSENVVIIGWRLGSG